VAGSASRRRGRHVRADEREACGAVIKFAVGPGGNRMARSAGGCCGGEARRDVIGDAAAKSRCFVPVRLMTTEAIRRIQRVIVVDVAGGAGSRRGGRVCTGQSETGYAVIEGSGIPAFGGVAVGAVRHGEGRSRRGMDWIICLLPGGQVAARIAAIRGRNIQAVVVVGMA